MKKVIIFLAIIVALFAAVGILTKMQNEEKVSEKNPYGKDSLHPETVKQLEDPNYQNLILPEELEKKLNNNEDVTVYFYSPTCPHCQKTTPVVAPLTEDIGIDLVQFNLLEFEDGWDNYGIKETPTIVQYKDGKEVNRITGSQEKEVFEQWFNENSK
ncbi:thioredoxin [Cytobacillus firmus]|uniref:Thioredoxin n=1 Tax=Cytobacillus firmus TaxID=1399 RepID=A0A380XG93_CYTFI|nr:thioredoxin family protein [Cytobacillus firmus]KAF0822052.1 Thioredoxin [Cytobacillus firmus]MBG9543475.1 thioredoxin [Cytobacillus firmus]MBG9548262.1 thioredoxin [Cytobacillus firmus]MBG9550805.1 thioredoxin [Cytobacillus firmus]MBG9556283.1 thioredoxin [Cytobacillus firmus]